MPVLPKHHVAYLRLIHLRGCIVCHLLQQFVDSCSCLGYVYLFVFAQCCLLANLIFVSLRYLAGRELLGESPGSVIEVNGSASG